MHSRQSFTHARRRAVLIASATTLALTGLSGLAQAQAWPAIPDVRQKFIANGSTIMEKGPDEFTAFHTAEINRWVPVIKASGATLD